MPGLVFWHFPLAVIEPPDATDKADNRLTGRAYRSDLVGHR